MLDKVLGKVLSGRWILTLIVGLVFAYAVYVKLLDAAATATIIIIVIKDYFSRPDRAPIDNVTPLPPAQHTAHFGTEEKTE